MKEPKSRIQIKLEEYFGIPFHKIVEKYFTLGMSRYKCSQILTELTNGSITVKHATLWNCVKRGITNGSITEFDFRTPKNNSIKKVRTISKTKKKKKINKVEISNNIIKTPVLFSCLECNKTHNEDRQLDSDNFVLLLMTHQCPHCKKRGKSSAEFVYKNKTVKKAVVYDEGTYAETFVDEEMIPISNPLYQFDNEESSIEEEREETVNNV